MLCVGVFIYWCIVLTETAVFGLIRHKINDTGKNVRVFFWDRQMQRVVPFWQRIANYLVANRYFWLLPTLIAGFGLRVHRLGDKSVWWDEGLAAWAARQSLVAISRWTAADVHPGLYFWLLHFWRAGTGDSEFALRYFSVLVGVLTIAAVYLLGKMIGGRNTAVFAGILLALSRFDIAWSQEMRMYALAALLAVLALWASIRIWQYGKPTDWLAYIFFMTAGLYTLYLFVLVLVVANFTWLVWVLPRAKEKWREFWRWSLGQGVVLLLFAPWLAYALGRIPTWTSASPITLKNFVLIYWTVLTTGIPLNVADYAPYTMPVLIIFLAGTGMLVWQSWQQRDVKNGRILFLLLIGLVFPAAVVFLVSLPKETFFYAPQMAPRYLIIFLGAYVVMMAWAITAIAHQNKLIGLVAGGFVVYVALLGLDGYHNGRVLRDDYIALTATIDAYRHDKDAVVLQTDTDWPIFAYHYPQFWYGVPQSWQITPETAETFLTPIWQQHDGLWLVVTQYAPVTDPNGVLVAWLQARALATRTFAYGDKTLYFFARTPERAANIQQLTNSTPRYETAVALNKNVSLVGYDVPTRDYHSGETIRLFTYWRVPESTERPITAEIELVAQNGRSGWVTRQITILADDIQPTNGIIRQQVDLLVPPEAPSGPYTFALNTDTGMVTFGKVTIHQNQATFLTPADVTISHPLNTSFDHGITLLGYDLDTSNALPGGTVHLTLYWQSEGGVTRPYKVFTHLQGNTFNAETGNFLWGQQDNEPVANTRPTTTWRAGEVIVDTYAIPVATHAPLAEYMVIVGLYDPTTGERVAVLDDAGTAVTDHVLLQTINLQARP